MTATQMSKENAPFHFEESRFLSVDLGEKVVVLPYISLRKVEYERVGEIDSTITLRFDHDSVTIGGENLDLLLPEIQRERLFSIRQGMHLDPSKPQIKLLDVGGYLDKN